VILNIIKNDNPLKLHEVGLTLFEYGKP